MLGTRDTGIRAGQAKVAKAKATQADFVLLVCRLNDAIVLRREIVKQRWNIMGMVSPGSPGMYENVVPSYGPPAMDVGWGRSAISLIS